MMPTPITTHTATFCPPRSMRAPLWLLAIMLCALCTRAGAEPKVFASGAVRTHMIELFSSEGCSSCPPAERWMNEFKSHKGLWTQYVPVVFHVNYWDRLGWKDRFATAAYTRRQYAYQDAGLLGGVYTPGILVNGQEYRQWFRGRQVPPPGRAHPGVLSVTLKQEATGRTGSENVLFHFQPQDALPGDKGQPVVFNLARLGFNFVTEVRAGENRGRELPHEFVVLSLNSVTSDAGGSAYQAALDLELDDTTAIAAWVSQGDGISRIMQATGGWLAHHGRLP